VRGRRARHHPPRWFHRTRYEAANGVRYQVVHAVQEPRFPLLEVARTSGWLAVWVPVGVVGALAVAFAVWLGLSWGWGL
jgi:hypothetical protein